MRPRLDRAVTRRTVLASGALGAGAAALAACNPGKSSTPGTTPTAAGGEQLVALSSVPVGGAVSATLKDGTPVAVAQPAPGTAVCFSAVCTHAGCTVEPSGDKLECPCHGSVFDAATGKVLQGPAALPLPGVAVHVTGGEVVTG